MLFHGRNIAFLFMVEVVLDENPEFEGMCEEEGDPSSETHWNKMMVVVDKKRNSSSSYISPKLFLAGRTIKTGTSHPRDHDTTFGNPNRTGAMSVPLSSFSLWTLR